jgi:septal ring-binding cell division protein DamX
LSQAPSIEARPAAAQAPTKAQAKPAVPASETAVPPKLSARVDAGLGLLDRPGDGRFVVQLMMTDARARDHLEWYIAEASRTLPADTLFLYPSGSGDSPKLGVIYGVFASRREATEALEALPANLRQFRPYVRSVDAVRSDVRRGAPA